MAEKQWHMQVCSTCQIALTGNSVHRLNHKKLNVRVVSGRSSKISTLRWTSYFLYALDETDCLYSTCLNICCVMILFAVLI